MDITIKIELESGSTVELSDAEFTELYNKMKGMMPTQCYPLRQPYADPPIVTYTGSGTGASILHKDVTSN